MEQAIRKERIAASRTAFSFDQPSGDGDTRPCVDPCSLVSYRDDYSEDVARLKECIRLLPDRLRCVIRGRMAGRTLRHLCVSLGCSHESVRQWELEARRLLLKQVTPLSDSGHVAG